MEKGSRSRLLTAGFRSPRWEIAIVGAATLVGLFARTFHLAAVPLSNVEIYTWDFSHQTVPFILGPLSHIETNPPLYYLLIKLVMGIGESELLLRLPSVIAGTLAIPLVYVLGRLGGAAKSGVIGALLLSLSAIAITYSREARTYVLLLDACLVAAIGAVIVLEQCRRQAPRSTGREWLGWTLFTLASIVGFYLHYTFIFDILVLECAIAASIGMTWLETGGQFDRGLIFRWVASCCVIALAMGWGFILASQQSHSDNIAWMQVPSFTEARRLFVRVDGYSGLSKLQPLPSLLLVGLAAIGLVAGWRRSSAVLVCGMLFALFPLVLFVVSQHRPMYIERAFVSRSFAVCLLAGYGTLYLVDRVSPFVRRLLQRRQPAISGAPLSLAVGAIALFVLFVPALISAANAVRITSGPSIEPFDKVAAYLASSMKPGDVAVGMDGVIYYRQRTKADFPYYKLAIGNTSEDLVTYGSAVARAKQVPGLARADHAIYLTLRRTTGAVIGDRRYKSSANYVLETLNHRDPPVASFGNLDVYRLSGSCLASAPCLALTPASSDELVKGQNALDE